MTKAIAPDVAGKMHLSQDMPVSPPIKVRPPLRALVIFEAAARHMSFRLAARELNLTPSAVSHHMKTLEEYLRESLFLRLNRGLRLTQTGTSYYQFVRDALERINEGTALVQRRMPRETLRIRTGGSFAQRWLLPRLSLFLAENPHLEIQIDTRTPLGEVSPDKIDLEIRYGELKRRGFVVEPLCEETILPLCSPALLRGPNPLRTMQDLAKHTLIESERSVVTWSMWLSQHAGAARDAPRLRFDSTSLALQAAVFGLGVTLEGDFLASEELASGRLVTPFLLRDNAMQMPLRYLVIPKANLALPNVRSFKDWLLRETQK